MDLIIFGSLSIVIGGKLCRFSCKSPVSPSRPEAFGDDSGAGHGKPVWGEPILIRPLTPNRSRG